MAGGDDADAEDAEADAGRMRTIVVAESGLVGRGIVQEKAGRYASCRGPPATVEVEHFFLPLRTTYQGS